MGISTNRIGSYRIGSYLAKQKGRQIWRPFCICLILDAVKSHHFQRQFLEQRISAAAFHIPDKVFFSRRPMPFQGVYQIGDV